MIEFVFLGLGILLTFAFYGVYHLQPKKKDVKGKNVTVTKQR